MSYRAADLVASPDDQDFARNAISRAEWETGFSLTTWVWTANGGESTVKLPHTLENRFTVKAGHGDLAGATLVVQVRISGYGTAENNAQSLCDVFIGHRPYPELPDWWVGDYFINRYAAVGFSIDNETDGASFPAEMDTDYYFRVVTYSGGGILDNGGESEMLLEVTVQVVENEVFVDGFESGDSSAWSASIQRRHAGLRPRSDPAQDPAQGLLGGNR